MNGIELNYKASAHERKQSPETKESLQRGKIRRKIKSAHCFDSINDKSQATQERSYSEERRRGRTPGIMNEVEGWQKCTEKLRQQEKSSKQFQGCPWLTGRRMEAEVTITK
jgi:hypothetical protein